MQRAEGGIPMPGNLHTHPIRPRRKGTGLGSAMSQKTAVAGQRTRKVVPNSAELVNETLPLR